jgi:DNA helicase-2/ATP-dependent DNA helicase PcrA
METDMNTYGKLDAQQREAVKHGDGPLLIRGGAGTGKTATLSHRIARLIAGGVAPDHIMLLASSQSAAQRMLHEVEAILVHGEGKKRQDKRSGARRAAPATGKVVSGTFRSVAIRLLRRHGNLIGLDPSFTVLDYRDRDQLMSVVRAELGLDKGGYRFPKHTVCTAIRAMYVNNHQSLDYVLASRFRWCQRHVHGLRRLLDTYDAKRRELGLLDHDDLLSQWHALLADPEAGEIVRRQIDHVMVDDYQDATPLQAKIVRLLRPGGNGLTVAGDESQAIRPRRGTIVPSMLDFAERFRGATVVTLEEDYRNTAPILEAASEVISQAKEPLGTTPRSRRESGEPPGLIACEDRDEELDFVIREVMEHREQGIELKRQAVLYREAHFSAGLESELMRRGVPFQKYGGRKLTEAAHVRDLLSFLRIAENPFDLISGSRVLRLLPGIGPTRARRLMDLLREADGDLRAWQEYAPSKSTEPFWDPLVSLLQRLASSRPKGLPAQIQVISDFYAPLLEQRFDDVGGRLRDLERLRQLARRFRSRPEFLAAMALDPPEMHDVSADGPSLNDDYLVLATVHCSPPVALVACWRPDSGAPKTSERNEQLCRRE